MEYRVFSLFIFLIFMVTACNPAAVKLDSAATAVVETDNSPEEVADDGNDIANDNLVIVLENVSANTTSVLDWVDPNDPDILCDLASATDYDSCARGGAHKKITLNGYTDCSNMDARDALGVYSWGCFVVEGVATMYSLGFRSGKGFKDLITETSWNNNFVEVRQNNNAIFQSTSEPWFDDVISNFVPDTDIATSGIYVVTTDTETEQINITADKVAIITLGTAKLTYEDGSATFPLFGVARNLIFFDDVDYGYVEGEFYLKNDISGFETSFGINFKNSKFGEARNLIMETGTRGLSFITDSGISKFNYITGSYDTTNGATALMLNSDNNLITATLNINDTADHSLFLIMVDDTEVSSDITCGTSTNRCVSVFGGTNILFSGDINANLTENGIKVGEADLGGPVVYSSNVDFTGDITLTNMTDDGIQLLEETSGSDFSGTISITNSGLVGLYIDEDSDNNTFSGSVTLDGNTHNMRIYDGADNNTLSNVTSLNAATADLDMGDGGNIAPTGNSVQSSGANFSTCSGNSLAGNTVDC